MWVCHSPPLSTGGLEGNAAKYFWFRGREGCWLRLVGVAVFVLLCFLDNRLVKRHLFTPPKSLTHLQNTFQSVSCPLSLSQVCWWWDNVELPDREWEHEKGTEIKTSPLKRSVICFCVAVSCFSFMHYKRKIIMRELKLLSGVGEKWKSRYWAKSKWKKADLWSSNDPLCSHFQVASSTIIYKMDVKKRAGQ